MGGFYNKANDAPLVPVVALQGCYGDAEKGRLAFQLAPLSLGS